LIAFLYYKDHTTISPFKDPDIKTYNSSFEHKDVTVVECLLYTLNF